MKHNDATKTERSSISGLVAEYIVAIDVTRIRFPADAPVPSTLPPTRWRRTSQNTGSPQPDQQHFAPGDASTLLRQEPA